LRVAVYYSNSDVRVEERPRPTAGPGELLMRVRASGICGSDVMEWYRRPKAPLVLGHEVAGTVEDVGDGVTGFAPGDRIVTTHHVPCGDCRYCRGDGESVCPTLRKTSFDPGGFAEFVRLPAINVARGTFALPDSVDFDAASFVEPLACVLRGQRLAGLRAGDAVAVLGSGISGVLHILAARAAGAATIFATDVSDHRVEAARRFGADEARLAADDPRDALRRCNDGRGADRVIVCAGAPGAFEDALAMVDVGGTILLFAPLDPGVGFEIPANELWTRCVSLVNSYAGPPDDMRAALDLLARGEIDVEPMITHRLGLAETQRGFQLLVDGGESLKVIIQPER
jgi:L-iditol 2-dehydrogenase